LGTVYAFFTTQDLCTNAKKLVQDLGVDLIHVYYAEDNGHMKETASLNVPPGTGPRHGIFWSPSPTKRFSDVPLYLLVVGELSGAVLVYRAKYLENAGMSFVLVFQTSALGKDIAKKFYPAEIQKSVSPVKIE